MRTRLRVRRRMRRSDEEGNHTTAEQHQPSATSGVLARMVLENSLVEGGMTGFSYYCITSHNQLAG